MVFMKILRVLFSRGKPHKPLNNEHSRIPIEATEILKRYVTTTRNRLDHSNVDSIYYQQSADNNRLACSNVDF